MTKKKPASISYSWWIPSLFLTAAILLLIAGVLRNTLFNPFEKGYREDIGHLENVESLIRMGALKGNPDGTVSSDELSFIAHAKKTTSLGRAFLWLEQNPNSIELNQGEVAFPQTAAEQDSNVPDLEVIESLRQKGFISFSPQGVLVLNHESFQKWLLTTPLGRHFQTARKNLKRFSWSVENGLQMDDFYFREINTFSVKLRIPKGSIFDRNGRTLAGWAEGKRIYPENNPGTFHVVGFENLSGLEKKSDSILEGHRDLGLHTLYGLLGNDQCGNDIRLSIDGTLSAELYAAFERKGKQLHGAVVLIEIKTGEILAAVSSPSLDLGVLKERPNFENLQENDEKPLLNRCWDEIFFPGSTYKTVVAATMLQFPDLYDENYKTKTDPNTKINDEKSFLRIRNHADSVAPRPIDMYLAFAVSSNTYFARQGVALGARVKDVAERLLFNKEMDVLANLKGGSWLTAAPSAYQGPAFSFEKKGDHRLVAQFSIGQNQIKSHPLHMASLAAAIANEGVWVNPTLISHQRKGIDVTELENTHSFKKTGGGPETRILEENDAEQLQKAMILVMNHQLGTGYKAHQIYQLKNDDGTVSYISKYRQSSLEKSLVQIAGKTGTAENKGKLPHAWFIGYAPAKNPQVAVAVIVENTGYGSVYAEPIAAKALAGGLNLLTIKD